MGGKVFTTHLSDVIVPDVQEAGPIPVHPGGFQATQRGQGVVVEDKPL